MQQTNGLDGYIGNTPLLRLKRLEETLGLGANVYAKAEWMNPGGSIKDRVAKAIIDDAEQKGRLKKGGTVIEATSGNTGIGLAMVAAARGYRAVIVMPDTMSEERRALIKGYGAEIVLTDGGLGMKGAVDRAEELCKSIAGSIIADQFNNPVCALAHYQTTAREAYAQLNGRIDIFVACVGTGGTLTGAGKFFKEKNPQVKVVAVEPTASPLLSKGIAGSHKIQGIGANFIPSVLDRSIYDEVLTVSDEQAFDTAKLLGKIEGAFVGFSSGAAAYAAAELAKRPENQGKNILTVLPDGGGRYLSTGVFSE